MQGLSAGLVAKLQGKLKKDADTVDGNGVLTVSSNPNFDKTAAAIKDEDEITEIVTPCMLVFSNVRYRAAPTKQEKREGKAGKLILDGCSGFCSPRTLTAIMGPSGSGKTSLLDILASRARQPPEFGSVIEVNGVPVHESTKTLSKTSGYVLQEDILHEYLTVFETLMFTARLILPSNVSDQGRYDRVMRVIAQLGLGHACDTKVGGPNVRGLSGGERRRVSVGVQIIKSPSLLFLDEPTSGLDSSTALQLVEGLRELANEGRTIIATIHQPGAQIFEFFDRLVLLSAGKVVWSGSRTAAENFFASKNRPVPAKWNPADWFLLVVNTVRDAPGAAATPDGKVENSPVDVDKRVMSYRAPKNPKRTSFKPSQAALRMTVAEDSRNVDVSVLTEVLRSFYAVNNPDKLKTNPEIVDEVVRYGLIKGIAELEKKLVKTYGKGIAAALSQENGVSQTAALQQGGISCYGGRISSPWRVPRD